MIPDGFIALDRPSPFLQRIGPLHFHGSGHALRMGLVAQKHHLNARGLVHGGVLATLADIALGYAMHGAQDPPHPAGHRQPWSRLSGKRA
ncbi:MAG TPA: PaaI family thioesterase [Burkholderiales bacterium]|nr:PaaI family thioesterase [Burkholderiales bacterium]